MRAGGNVRLVGRVQDAESSWETLSTMAQEMLSLITEYENASPIEDEQIRAAGDAAFRPEYW